MINRLRRGISIPQGSGETVGFAVRDNGGLLAADFGLKSDGTPDQVVVAIEGVGAVQVGSVQNIRRRFTIAEVNAGITLLPAKVGYKYRMTSAHAISVGGAAAAVTTVDITGTASASSRKLVAFGQAALTQSAVVTSGGTGGTVLADGASYIVNDANTAIGVSKTGSSVTTATHIDISFNFVVEKA